jgi:hypothetical protein
LPGCRGTTGRERARVCVRLGVEVRIRLDVGIEQEVGIGLEVGMSLGLRPGIADDGQRWSVGW